MGGCEWVLLGEWLYMGGGGQVAVHMVIGG